MELFGPESPTILTNHRKALARYYGISRYKPEHFELVYTLNESMKNYKVIPVPLKLFESHISPKDFNLRNAMYQSFSRFDMPNINTVFENTAFLYYYPALDLAISETPLKAYQVDMKNHRAKYVGYKWAIFMSPPIFHFDSKSLQIPTNQRCLKKF